MADDLKDTMEQNAEGLKQARADGVDVRQHALGDKITGGKHLSGGHACQSLPVTSP